MPTPTPTPAPPVLSTCFPGGCGPRWLLELLLSRPRAEVEVGTVLCLTLVAQSLGSAHSGLWWRLEMQDLGWAHSLTPVTAQRQQNHRLQNQIHKNRL